MTIVRIAILSALLLVPTVLVAVWVSAAETRLEESSAEPGAEPTAAVAAPSDEAYCNPGLKQVLRRVLLSCGLMSEGGGTTRGCQPVQARSVATMSGDDFNALFQPMRQRGGIVQFETGRAELDPGALALVDQLFADRRGASWFFVVARASPEGSVERNRELSKARAEAVMTHLRATFQDPDLDREVGLLWLGEEFAQLDEQFCQWRRSADGECTTDDINRSAFVAWIDCRL
jgi:outer membrane protein OmpA-like peptidoglycan-associated protein